MLIGLWPFLDKQYVCLSSKCLKAAWTNSTYKDMSATCPVTNLVPGQTVCLTVILGGQIELRTKFLRWISF